MCKINKVIDILYIFTIISWEMKYIYQIIGQILCLLTKVVFLTPFIPFDSLL